MINIIRALIKTKLLTFKGIWLLLKSIPTVGMNLMALLYVRQKLCPQQIAINENGNELDYQTLYNQVQHLAKQLAAYCKIQPGQKIAMMANNHSLLIQTLFALARLGADIYLINTELSSEQLKNINHNIDFDLIIYDPEVSEIASSLAISKIATLHDNQVCISSLLKSPLLNQTIKLKVTHFSKITVLTSGTTQRFKLATRKSHAQNFITPFCQLLIKLKLSHYNKVYIATPIYHGFGLATLCFSTLLGATIFITKRFQTQIACNMIAKYQIEVVTLVPLMLSRMINHSEQQLRSLRCIITGGAPITITLVNRVLNQLGKVLFNLYGTSEAGVCMIATPDDLSKNPTTIGKPIKGLRTKLISQNHTTPGTNELFIKCAWSISGKDWIATGDLAEKDNQGYYYLKGRVDDMIVSGGENVYPFEIENHLLKHEEIKEVAIICVDNEEFGQRFIAFIVLTPKSMQTESSILTWLRAKVARFQLPKKIYIVDEFPMTGIGKVDRKKLKQLIEQSRC